MLRGRALSIGRSTATILFVAACVAGTPPAMAKVGIDLTGGATVGVEHDSNPFQLAQFEALPAGTDGSKRDDTSMRLSANASAAFIAGPVELQLLTTFTHVESQRFDGLSRNNFDVNGNLLFNSNKNSVYDFSLQYTQSHLPVGPADVGGSTAVQQKTRSAQGTLRVRPTSRWQIGLTPSWSDSQTPLEDGPDYGYRVTSGRLSLNYLGAGRIVPGIDLVEGRGRYTGTTNDTRFREQTAQGTLAYRTKGLTTVTLAAGYTERTTHLTEPSVDPAALALEGTVPAFTGSLDLRYQLSVKTSFSVTAYRAFQQFQGSVNTTISTGFLTRATWSATSKITASIDSAFDWSNIDGVAVAGAPIQRQDLVRRYSFTVSYAATRRVSVRTYVTRQMRNSTSGAAQFNSTLAGMELSARID